MVQSTGSDSIGGINQSGDNTFGDAKFWFQWIEFTNDASNLTEAGFNTADGSINPSATIYNAGQTNDLDALVSDGSAATLGNDTTNDYSRFAVRATTNLEVTNAGTYTFDVRSDDGMIFYVDGVQVINDDSLHGPRTRFGSIDLTPGSHEIVVIYFERTGRNVLEVGVTSDASGDYPSRVALQDATVSANAQNDTVDAKAGNDTITSGAGDDTIDGGSGDDTIDGGSGNDTLDGGAGNDTLTGGTGNDVFTVSGGSDTITDFNAGNTGALDDGDTTNNDFVDLSGFYNATTLNAVNSADADPSNDFDHALDMLREDADDGQIDGVINGIDYSAQIGNINLTIENGGSPVTGTNLTFDNTNVPCFTTGTLIETEDGPRPVETLALGQMVQTLHGDLQPIRWIGRRHYSAAALTASPNLRPIRIHAGALGANMPTQDLTVSPQHRILVRSAIAERMFGTSEVLVAAKRLLEVEGVCIATDLLTVEYHHIMFDQHEVIVSNGLPTESLFAGQQTLNALSDDSRAELLTIFPELRDETFQPSMAALIPENRKQKRLVARHVQNQQPFICG